MADDAANSEPTARVVGRPFPPGVSGNPNGRPKDDFSFAGLFRAALAQKDDTGRSVGQRLVDRYIELGLAGNPTALEALVARIDGKPAQSLTLKGDTDAPLHVRHSARLEMDTPGLEAPDSPPHPPALADVGGAGTGSPDSGYVGTQPQLPAPEQAQGAAEEGPGVEAARIVDLIADIGDDDAPTPEEPGA